MRKNILPKDVSINIGHFIEMGDSPIDFHFDGDLCNEIKDNTLNGLMSSYPIYKDGKCYELKVEVDPKMYCVNWCGKEEWHCTLTNLIYPMAMRLKEEYELMEANTQKEDAPMLLNEVRIGNTYKCWHTLYDLYVEELIVDTDKMTIEMELGS